MLFVFIGWEEKGENIFYMLDFYINVGVVLIWDVILGCYGIFICCVIKVCNLIFYIFLLIFDIEFVRFWLFFYWYKCLVRN